MTVKQTFSTYSKNPQRDEGQKRPSELSEGQTESLLDNCTDTEEEEMSGGGRGGVTKRRRGGRKEEDEEERSNRK